MLVRRSMWIYCLTTHAFQATVAATATRSFAVSSVVYTPPSNPSGCSSCSLATRGCPNATWGPGGLMYAYCIWFISNNNGPLPAIVHRRRERLVCAALAAGADRRRNHRRVKPLQQLAPLLLALLLQPEVARVARGLGDVIEALDSSVGGADIRGGGREALCERRHPD